MTATDLAGTSPAQARALFRGGLVTSTAGWSAGSAEANLVALPREDAWDFLLFTQRNPEPCPVLDVLDAGEVGGRCSTATCAPTCRSTGCGSAVSSSRSPPTCSPAGAATSSPSSSGAASRSSTRWPAPRCR